MRLTRFIVTTLLLLLVSGALSAYTIYLKDGSKLIARKKYEVQRDRALILLSTGTTTSIAFSEIDVPRTDEANKIDYGSAVILDDNSEKALPTLEKPKPRKTLSQVIRPGASSRLVRQQDTPSDPTEEPTVFTPPPAAHKDLTQVRRTPYGAVDISNQLMQLLRSRGVEEVSVFQGTERERILVDIVTNSEASVFRALEASAKALETMAEQRPADVAALEILMKTDRRVRAGQFLMTVERAKELNHSQIDPQQFFLRYVEF